MVRAAFGDAVVVYPERLEVPSGTLVRWNHVAHADAFAEICTDPVVMEFLGGPASLEYSLEGSRRIDDHWDTFGFGLWAVLSENGDLAGFAGGCFPLWHPDLGRTPEIGWRLARFAWGRGYATAGGRLALDALRELGHDDVISIIDPANENSLAVAGGWTWCCASAVHTRCAARRWTSTACLKYHGPPEGDPLVAINKPAATYSPGPLQDKYHRRYRA